MGKNRLRSCFYQAKGKVMAEKNQKSEVRSQRISKQHAVDSRQLLLTAYCLLLTVFTGCASRQIIVTKDPLKAEEHIRLANIYEAKGETGLAAEEYKKALEQDKADPLAYFGLGNISYKNGAYEDAEAFYKKAIQSAKAGGPQIAVFYNNLSWVYIESNKNLLEAEKLAGQATLLDAENYIYLDTLGVAYTKRKEYAKAEDALLSALKNAQEDKTALRYIYQHFLELYELQGDKDKSDEMAEKLKEFGK